jgi:hypothetical protein
VQMIIALVAGLVLVAVPLYLWRRPEPGETVDPMAQVEDAGAGAIDGAVPYVPQGIVDASSLNPKVKLSPFKSIRCEKPGRGKTPPERCEHIDFFEDALVKAIQENVLCAPTSKKGVSVSFVMELDFRRKQLNIYHGKSSSVPKTQTKELFRCIKRAMPAPEWGSIPHQHSKYVVNLIADYPPTDLF